MNSVLPGLRAFSIVCSGRLKTRANASVGRPEKNVESPMSSGLLLPNTIGIVEGVGPAPP
jgi:hypothetical protein